MKFWEAISAFRDEPEILATVFGSDRWRLQYLELYDHFDELVREQRRDVMDMPLPLELTRDIAAHYQRRKFWYDPRQLELRAAEEGVIVQNEIVELTALEVHNRFGGSVIEQVYEYGSVQVKDGT